ncbi:MAG TPA: glycosyltransferase family 39 protein [Dehalococcoidia bacterium]|nr:glycosyltransferase family 39 protein [Dehalococcoidia bacterium]
MPTVTLGGTRRATRIAAAVSDATALAGLLLIALAWRWSVAVTVSTGDAADSSQVAQVAARIGSGERPLFLPDSPPVGSLEAYLTAPLIAQFGPSAGVVRAVPLLLALAFVLATYAIGRTVWDARVAWWSAVIAAVGPAFLILAGVSAGRGAPVVLALGTAALALLACIRRRPGSQPAAFGLAGLLIGLACWTRPVGLVYLLPAVGLAVTRWRRWADDDAAPTEGSLGASALPSDGRQSVSDPAGTAASAPADRTPPRSRVAWEALAGLLGLILGAWPLIWTALQSPDSVPFAQAPAPDPLDLARRARDLVIESLPIVAGFLQPSASADLFEQQLREARIWQVGGLCIALAAIAGVAWHVGLAVAAGRRPGAWWLIPLLPATPIAFLVPVLGWSRPTDPTDLLPWYSLVPLVVAIVVRSPGYRRRGRRLLLFVPLVILWLSISLGLDPRLYRATESLPPAAGQAIDRQVEAARGASNRPVDRGGGRGGAG